MTIKNIHLWIILSDYTGFPVTPRPVVPKLYDPKKKLDISSDFPYTSLSTRDLVRYALYWVIKPLIKVLEYLLFKGIFSAVFYLNNLWWQWQIGRTPGEHVLLQIRNELLSNYCYPVKTNLIKYTHLDIHTSQFFLWKSWRNDIPFIMWFDCILSYLLAWLIFAYVWNRLRNPALLNKLSGAGSLVQRTGPRPPGESRSGPGEM